MSLSIDPQEREHQRKWTINIRTFALLLFAIVGGAVLRSAVATRLDSFHLDEGYHIAAGVSYVRHADFRINPEHAPQHLSSIRLQALQALLIDKHKTSCYQFSPNVSHGASRTGSSFHLLNCVCPGDSGYH